MKKKISLLKNKRGPMTGIIQKIKIFKKRLNFFDVTVIFLLFLLLSFLIYNRLQRKSTWVDLRIQVSHADWWYRGNAPKYWYTNELKVGDSVKDSFGDEVAKVVNIDNYDLGGPYRDIYIDLKVKTDYNKSKDQYLYEFKPLTVGSYLVFNFSKQQVRGLVISMGETEIDYFYKKIKVEKKALNPSLAEKIVVGAKSYDSENDLVAEIIDVKSEISSKYEFSDIRGQNVKSYNPDYRDLEIVLKVKAFRDLERDFYINNAALKVGSEVWIQFPDFALEGVQITEIFED